MYYKELIAIMADRDKARATQSMFTLMRQGLTNGAAIPEVETEGEQAAHHMLGCTNFLAMITLYATADDLRPDEPAAAAVLSDLADEHLMLLTKAIMLAGGPIGEHLCTGVRQP